MQSHVSNADRTADSTPARQVALSMLLGAMRSDDLLRFRVAEQLAKLEHSHLVQVA